MNVVLETLQGYVPTILQMIGAVLGVIAVQAVKAGKNWVEAKIGQTNFNRAVEVAKGLYVLLEDEFKEVEKAGEEKKDIMRQRLLEQFPGLTETELKAINKLVWESFNKEYSAGWGELASGIDVTTEVNLDEDAE